MSGVADLVYRPVVGRLVLLPLCRWGLRRQRAAGTTPRVAYRAMRKLYGNDDPRLFASLEDEVVRDRPSEEVGDDPAGVASGEIDRLVADLRRDGYAVLAQQLPSEVCDEIEAVARQATCTVIGGAPSTPERARWDPASPWTVRANLEESDIVQAPAVQRFVADESLLALAQAYLGAAPVQDLVAMWWSAAPELAAVAPDTDAAAQEFHFDLDRLRWLKVFVLLSDVDDRHGPHVYARGSHRDRPAALRRDGRKPDRMVEEAFPDGIVRLGGPRGTIFAVDTRGLHKGAPLEEGQRLMFQVEYAVSLFGAPYAVARVERPTEELAAAVARHPEVFARFRLSA